MYVSLKMNRNPYYQKISDLDQWIENRIKNFKISAPAYCLLQSIALLFTYVFFARLGLKLEAVEGFAALVWPPSGIALTALLLSRFRLWPVISLAAFIVNWSAGASIGISLLIASGNTLEAVIAAFFLRRSGFSLNTEKLSDVLGLFLIAVLLSTLVGATLGATSLWIGSIIDYSQYFAAWRSWWIGDALGDLVVVPLALALAPHSQSQTVFKVKKVEVILFILFLFAISFMVFSGNSNIGVRHYPISYSVFPFIIWAALRFGQIGTSSVTFLLAIVSVIGTSQGYGPFVRNNLSESLLFLQAFIAIVSITGMTISTIVTARQRAQASLRQSNDQLEEKVERRTTELRKSEERFRLIVNNVKDYAIFMLTPTGHVFSWNEGARRIKGYESQEIIGKHFSIFYSDAEKEQKIPEIELLDAIQHGRVEHEGYRVRKDGSTFWANAVITALKDEKQNLIGFSKITKDLTPQKKAQDQVRHAYATMEKQVEERTLELREALRSRDEFLSIASHELKTPLTSLLLQIQLLFRLMPSLRQDSSETTLTKVMRTLNQSEIQCKKVGLLVDDLLDLSRIRAGKMTLNLERVDLKELTQEVIARLEGEIKKKQITISIQSDHEIHGYWDKTRIDQVLTNLISNAIKYGNSNPIEVQFESTGKHVKIIVRDKGIGISAEDQKRIFERFERATSDMIFSGLGLGLYITRQITAAHGGTIEVQSKLGEYSIFTVTLPIQSVSPEVYSTETVSSPQ